MLTDDAQCSPQIFPTEKKPKGKTNQLIMESHVLGHFHFHCSALVSEYIISDLDHFIQQIFINSVQALYIVL